MFTRPIIVADIPGLQAVAAEERVTKAAAAASVNCSEDELKSNEKFAAVLESRGVAVPTKAGKRKANPCVASDDAFLIALKRRDDAIGHLARAREIVKSSITESRARKLIALAGEWFTAADSLTYCAADTTRWAGTGGTNFQNLPRDSKSGAAYGARRTQTPDRRLRAGRVSGAMRPCRSTRHARRVACRRDLYVEFATELYGRPITKADKPERGVGKKGVLSSGYGCGWETFKRDVIKKSFSFRVTRRGAPWRSSRNGTGDRRLLELCDRLIAALFQAFQRRR